MPFSDVIQHHMYMALENQLLLMIRNNKDFEDQAKIFANPNSAKADVIKAGEGTWMPIQSQIRST